MQIFIVLLVFFHYIYADFSIKSHNNLACIGKKSCTLETDRLEFFLLGDIGGLPIYPYKSYAQIKVAETMARLARHKNLSFVINTGDNFYFNGVQDVFDKRFEKSFEDVYSDSILHFPWYTIAGNHDHLGNVSAQIAYTNYSHLWTFPDFYYKISYKFGKQQKTTVDIFMLDTIQGDVQGSGIIDWIFAKHKKPEKPEDENAARKQLVWLEDEISKSQADFVFVVGHDHNLQHIKVEKWVNTPKPTTLDYVVSGAGSRSDRSTKNAHSVPEHSLLFSYPDGWNPFSQIGFSNGGFVQGG